MKTATGKAWVCIRCKTRHPSELLNLASAKCECGVGAGHWQLDSGKPRLTREQRRAKQERQDFDRAFNVSKRHPKGTEKPRYCPVRIERNPINPPGHVCGKLHTQDVAPEAVPREDGTIIGWRCVRGHLFLRMPPEALNDNLVGAVFEITENRITENGKAMRVRVDAVESEIATTTSALLKVQKQIPVEVLLNPRAYTRIVGLSS